MICGGLRGYITFNVSDLRGKCNNVNQEHTTRFLGENCKKKKVLTQHLFIFNC